MWLALWDRDFRDFGTSETEREQKKNPRWNVVQIGTTTMTPTMLIVCERWNDFCRWILINGFIHWSVGNCSVKSVDNVAVCFFRFFLVWYRLFLKKIHNLQLNVLWKILQSIWSTSSLQTVNICRTSSNQYKKRPQHKPSFAASNCTHTHRYKFSTLIMLYQEATNPSCQHWHETSPASSFWHGKTAQQIRQWTQKRFFSTMAELGQVLRARKKKTVNQHAYWNAPRTPLKLIGTDRGEAWNDCGKLHFKEGRYV